VKRIGDRGKGQKDWVDRGLTFTEKKRGGRNGGREDPTEWYVGTGGKEKGLSKEGRR